MTIYWRLKEVPELAPLTPNERRQVHEICLRRHFLYTRPTRRSLFAYVALLSSGIIFVILGTDLLAPLGASDSLLSMAAISTIGTIGTILGWFVFTQIAIPSLRPFYGKFIESEM